MFRNLSILALVLTLVASARGQNVDGNLVEYGSGDLGSQLLTLGAPPVKIWRNGQIVFIRDGVWIGKVPAQRLARLEKDLTRFALLGAGTRYVEVKPVRGISPHGGMSYLRFGDGASEVIVATHGVPYRGQWQRIIDRIRKEIPVSATQWIPEQVTFYSREWDSPPGKPWRVTAWPFSDRVPLVTGADRYTGRLVTTRDRQVIAFLMTHTFQEEAWRFLIEAGGKHYQVYIHDVPGWLEPVGMTSNLVSVLGYRPSK